MKWWFRQSLTTKIFIGMVAGMIVGLIYPPIASIKFVGDIFIRFIQVAIVPLVFSVLVVSMASIDLRSFGRLGAKVLFFYTFTTVIATVVGVVLANVMHPGVGLDPTVLAKLTPPKPATPPPLAEIFLNMVPVNIVDAAAKGSMIQIVLFAIFFGLIIGVVGKKAEPVRAVLEGVYQIMVKMVWAIMEMAPYGVFALMGWLTAVTGFKALLPLAKYILATIIGVTFQTFIVVSIFVALIARVNPWQFYKRSLDYMMVAFTTRSSAASLPIALQVAEQKLGIHPRIAGFSLPLGSVMNQDGTAIWWPLAAMFIAQLYGIPITLEQQFYLVVLVNLIGLGSTGIPSGGIILLAMILTGMGWPVEGIALIIGVDVIPDMFRTTLNVVDDLSGALMVAATEKGMLRRDILSGARELGPDEITFTGAEKG
jgi:proton glutamate symport protein